MLPSREDATAPSKPFPYTAQPKLKELKFLNLFVLYCPAWNGLLSRSARIGPSPGKACSRLRTVKG